MRKPVFGVGVNDADYVTEKRINGKCVICPFYLSWRNMLQRCYSKNYQERQPTYKDCSVCEEWLTFSKFKEWMDSQYWYMMQLDKDLLVKGNKVYSPETCIFISRQLNTFTTESSAKRGEFPIGVYFNKKNERLHSQCNNPFTKKEEHLGYFDCPNEAHEEWRKRKHEHACKWADIVEDPRLKKALRERYAP